MEIIFKSSTHTIKLTQDGIAYICIPSFKEGENLKKEFYHNLELLERCKGFIIDLRENEGGGCLGASAVAQAFIEGEVEGTLQKVPYFLGDIKANSMSNYMFYKVDSDKRRHDDCPMHLKQPLVILSDGMTVSAAEEFLAYFKGKGRGVIVGTYSMGTNGSPIVENLPGGGYYKICTMQTILSDGTEFINRGIEPDIFVENTLEDLKNNFDRVLDKGLEVVRNS